MSILEPKAGILDIAPYKGGESKISGVERVTKLSSNEGAFGPSPKAVAAFKETAETLHRYPDGHATKLRQTIAARYGLDASQVVCGAGSDELLSLLCQAYAAPGDEVLYTEHGFLIYAIAAKAVGATPIAVPETDLTADVDAILAHATPATRMVFIANPNNPTGTYVSLAELRRLRAGLADDVVLVLDGAYAEYVDAADYSAGMELVAEGHNTVMTRTFSKIYGLGGLRLGWAYCPPNVADVLNRIRGPFNISTPAIEAGVAAFNDEAFIDMSRRHNTEWRKRTADALRQLGLFVPDGVCNFVLVRFPDTPGQDAAAADAALKARGIIVRRVTAYGLPDCLRITIGKADEMEAVIATLRAFMGADG